MSKIKKRNKKNNTKKIKNKKNILKRIYENVFFSNPLFLGVFLFSCVLRLIPILWGTQTFDFYNHYFHPDEDKITGYAYTFPLKFLSGQLFHYKYPNFLGNVLGVFWNGLKLLGVEEYNTATLLFRILAWNMGCASVYFTATIVKHYFSINWAVLSMLLLNTAHYHVLNSPLMTPDVPSSFFATLIIYLQIKYFNLNEIKLKHFAILGFLCGLSVVVKYTMGIMVIVVIILVVFLTLRNRQKFIFYLKGSAVACVSFLIGTLIFTPDLLIDYKAFREALDYLYNEHDIANKSYSIAVLKNIKINFYKGGSQILGILGVLGALISLLYHKKIGLITILILTIVYFSQVGLSFLPRYSILVSPWLAILGILPFVKIADLVKNKIAIYLTYGLISIFILMQYYPLKLTIKRYTGDSRYKLQTYFEKNIPYGTTVGLANIGNYRRTLNAWQWPKLSSLYINVDGLNRPNYMVFADFDSTYVVKGITNEKLLKNKDYWKFGMDTNVANLYYSIFVEKNSPYKFVAQIKPDELPIEFHGYKYSIYKRFDNKK